MHLTMTKERDLKTLRFFAIALILSFATVVTINSWGFDGYPIRTVYGTYYYLPENDGYLHEDGTKFLTLVGQEIKEATGELLPLGYSRVNVRSSAMLEEQYSILRYLATDYDKPAGFYRYNTFLYTFEDNTYSYILLYGGVGFSGELFECLRKRL